MGDVGGQRLRLPGGVGADDEGVGAGRDHAEEEGVAASGATADLEVQPSAEAGIVDLRAALPEIGREGAPDAEVVEPEFDIGPAATEVTARIRFADVQAGTVPSVFMDFDQHKVTFRGVDLWKDTYGESARAEEPEMIAIQKGARSLDWQTGRLAVVPVVRLREPMHGAPKGEGN